MKYKFLKSIPRPLWFLTILGAVAIGWLTCVRPAPAVLDYLELEVTVENPDRMEFFWDFGKGYVGDRSTIIRLEGGAAPQQIRLTLPDQPLRGVRWDPVESDQTTVLHRMEWVRESPVAGVGELPRTNVTHSLQPLDQVQELEHGPDNTRIQPEPGVRDPQLLLSFPGLHDRKVQALEFRPRLLGLLLVGAWVVGVLLLAQLALRIKGHASKPVPSGSQWIAQSALLLLLFPVAMLSAYMTQATQKFAWGNPGALGFNLVIEAEMETQPHRFSQLFFDFDESFHEGDTAITYLDREKEGAEHEVRFRLPATSLPRLRWDPYNGSGTVLVHRIYWENLGRQGDIPMSQVIPIQQISSIESHSPDGPWLVTTEEDANDPVFLITEWIPNIQQTNLHQQRVLRQLVALWVVAWLAFLLCWVWDGPRRNPGVIVS